MKAEREAVAWVLIAQKPARPALPCTVLLERIAPSIGLDDDNLAGSLKAVRDAIAEWLGLDDRDPRVAWKYAQRRGAWAVEVAFA